MNAQMGSLFALFAFVFGAVLTLGTIVMGIFFLLSLQRALELCSPEYRTLAPGKVWLCFVPVFNAVWMFVVVSRVASSLRGEFESRGAPSGDYGRAVGLTYCILAVAALATAVVPVVGATAGLACLVCLIAYWVTIAGYSKRLRQGQAALEPGWEGERPEAEGPFDLGRAWSVLLILVLAAAAQHLQDGALGWFAMPLQHQFGLTSPALGAVFSAYTLGLILGCVLMTLVTCLCGTRWGLVAALAGMSVTAAGWGLVSGQAGLLAVRALSGFFAGGLLPAAIQSLREYFPPCKRPLAIGVFIASIPLAALLAQSLGARITGAMDWRTGMTAAGGPALVIAGLCWFVWRQPARPAGPRSVSAVGVVSTVMLGAGVLFCVPLLTFVQTWTPMLVRRMGGSPGALSTVMAGAGAGGALIAGVAAWAAMRGGASPWKTRAALLTLCGLVLPIAAVWGAHGSGSALAPAALIAGAFEAWSTLLYAAVADTLPVRGVSVGAAAGALTMAEAGVFSTPWVAAMMTGGGPEAVYAILAGLATAGLVCVASLAWFIHPGRLHRPAAAPAAA